MEAVTQMRDGVLHVKDPRVDDDDCEYPDDSIAARRKQRKEQAPSPHQPMQVDPRIGMRPTPGATWQMACSGARLLEGRPRGPLADPKVETLCTDSTGCSTQESLDGSLYDEELWSLKEYNANERTAQTYTDDFGREVTDYIRHPEFHGDNVEDKRDLGRGFNAAMKSLEGGVDMTKPPRRRNMEEKRRDMSAVVAEKEASMVNPRDAADRARERQKMKSQLYALRTHQSRMQVAERKDNTLLTTTREERLRPNARFTRVPKPKTDVGKEMHNVGSGRFGIDDTGVDYDPRAGTGKGVCKPQEQNISMIVARRREGNTTQKMHPVEKFHPMATEGGAPTQVVDDIMRNTAEEKRNALQQQVHLNQGMASAHEATHDSVGTHILLAKEQVMDAPDGKQVMAAAGAATKQGQQRVLPRDRMPSRALGDAETTVPIDHGQAQHRVANPVDQNRRDNPSERPVFQGTDRRAVHNKQPEHAAAKSAKNPAAPRVQDQQTDIPEWLRATKETKPWDRQAPMPSFASKKEIGPSHQAPQTRDIVNEARDAPQQTIVKTQHTAKSAHAQTPSVCDRPFTREEVRQEVDYLTSLYQAAPAIRHGAQQPAQVADGIEKMSIRDTRQTVEDSAHQSAAARKQPSAAPRVQDRDSMNAHKHVEKESTAPRILNPTGDRMAARPTMTAESDRPQVHRDVANVVDSRIKPANVAMDGRGQVSQQVDATYKAFAMDRVSALPQRAAVGAAAGHRYSAAEMAPQRRDRPSTTRTGLGMHTSRRMAHPHARGADIEAARRRSITPVPLEDGQGSDVDAEVARIAERAEAFASRESCRIGKIGYDLRAPSPAFPRARTPQLSAKRN